MVLGVPVADAASYTLSADGQEVTDTQRGLIWRRCAEGLLWDGSACNGTTIYYTHALALQRAASVATTTAMAWRLPNVKELLSIVDENRADPAIDIVAFPSTPSSGFWSSSPYVGDASGAWFVYFYYGNVGGGNRDLNYAVRLVRASQ